MISETKQYEIIANGAVWQLEALLTKLNVERVFFVVDKLAYEFSSAAKALESSFKNRTVIWFSDYEINPKLNDVEKGISFFCQNKVDAVIAFGGGSAIDMAKLIAGCSVQKGKILDYIKGERTLKENHPPLIAIPTTAGTGSEATHFAVVYVQDKKYSLAHPYLLPEYVLIDPELTYNLPPRITASTGLDTLSQAIESIWSVGSTDKSIEYASESLSLVLDHFENTVNKPTAKSRMAMARAANLAGKAINISKTTAPHAISYAITTKYHVSHGIAVALTLDAFLSYNFEVDDASCNDPRGANSVRNRITHIIKILGNGSVKEIQDRLRSIKESVGCPMHLSEVGIKKDSLLYLVNQVNLERLSNNPRRIDKSELYDLLESIL